MQKNSGFVRESKSDELKIGIVDFESGHLKLINKQSKDQLKVLRYKRRNAKMSNINNKHAKQGSPSQPVREPQSEEKTQKRSIFDKTTIISTVIATILSTTILSIATFTINLVQSPKKEIAEMRNSIDEIRLNCVKMETNIENLQKDVEKLENKTYASINADDFITKLIPTEELTRSMNDSIKKVNASMPIYLSAPTWKSSEIIAIDSKGNELTAGELINTKLLLAYENEGQEVFFYGQYNEKNQWNGECVINVYKNNELLLITEAIYEGGIIQTYKQVLPAKKHEKKIWIISDRKNEGDYNSGESWRYFYEPFIPKSFNLDTVSSSDILMVNSFEEKLNTNLEGYYYGNTSNGLYNDTSENAYLIKYDEQGYISLLYCGNFKDGKFEDNTGNSWYITRNEDTDYMYFKGKFKDGKPNKDSDYEFQNNLTIENINSYISGMEFNVELRWAKIDSI